MDKLNICLINDSFPPAIDGVANAVTNYAKIIQNGLGNSTVVTPFYPDADDSVFDFPVVIVGLLSGILYMFFICISCLKT